MLLKCTYIENSLVEFDYFVVQFYAINWFTDSNGQIQPLNDVKCLRKLHAYLQINTTSESVIVKLLNNFYY